MRIITPERSSQPQSSIEAEFLLNDASFKVFSRTNEVAILSGNKESFLASGLLPCMKSGGGQLTVEGEVSRQFLAGLSRIQDIYCSWDSSLRRVETRGVTPVSRSGPSGNRVGIFFSGGVDSFYSFLKHQHEITDLIFVQGFNPRLKDTLIKEQVSKKIRDIALSFGKNFIEIETNIRELLNPYVNWGKLAHGAALAAVSHLLSPAFCRIYISSTHTYADSFPWGSHPDLDPLWSTESLEFVHDGCEATRVEKVALISKHDIALQSLRVCTKNLDGSNNCGQCEKCIRTMINLKVNNALDRCSAFDKELDVKQILEIDAERGTINESKRAFIRENLEALEKSHADKELENALKIVLTRPEWRWKIKRRMWKVKNSLKKRLR